MAKHLAPLPGQSRPLLFAHRGLSSEAPENTMAAFRLARDYGIPGVELDIHLTADDRMVVAHDYNTDRTSPDNKLTIAGSNWEQLRTVDVGAWKDPKYAGEHIPLLSDLLEEHGKDFYFDIEMKSRDNTDGHLEAMLARLLDDFKMEADRVVVSSFNPVMLAKFKATCPGIPTAIIYCADDDVPWYLRRGEGRWIAGADFLKPKHVIPTRIRLAFGRAIGGRQVLPWTVDDPAIARRMIDIGCEGVISNKPHALGLRNGD
ncbi:MAG: glycerophosphodiester phosphodiesterase [Clostridia bacterium]|nr:glycerophosphodiester phosphodiesterase family protein [Spirochaetia bacterium]